MIGLRRLVVLIPVTPGAHAAARRRRWVALSAFVVLPVIVLFLTKEVLGWRIGAIVACFAVIVGVGLLAAMALTVRDFGILPSADGTANLRVPNLDAARAYREALEAAGAASPRACKRCGTPPGGIDDGTGDDLAWFCDSCSREPASAGGPKRRPLWLLFPFTLAIVLFVLPWLVLRGALSRMARGPVDCVAAVALLTGGAAVALSGIGTRTWPACGMAIAWTVAAGLLARGPGHEPARKVVYFSLGIDLLALLLAVSRAIVEL